MKTKTSLKNPRSRAVDFVLTRRRGRIFMYSKSNSRLRYRQ